jgi:hypothetical protein
MQVRSRDLVTPSGIQSQLRYAEELANALADLRRAMLNMPLSDPGIAIANNAAKVKTAATLVYLIDGVFCSKGATDDFWTLAGITVPAEYYQKYLLCIDANGAASIVQGTPHTTAAGVVLPDWPDSKCIAGVLQVFTTGATFVPGTTLLSAGAVTDTYYDGFPGLLPLRIIR